MRILRITERIGNDFWADMECESCGHKEKLGSGYYDSNYFQNVLPNMECASCKATGLQWRAKQEEIMLHDLCEIAHYFGGWNELRKKILELESNDNEAAYERAMSNP